MPSRLCLRTFQPLCMVWVRSLLATSELSNLRNTCVPVSIRAYGAEQTFKQESMERLNHFVRISRTSFNLNRWVGLRIDSLGALLTASMAAFLVYGKQIGASNTGFSLMFTSEFCIFLFWAIRIFNDLEVECNRCVLALHVFLINNIIIL